MNTKKELTVQDYIAKDTIAFLKGMVVGHSVNRGMKWVSTKKLTPAFELGMKVANSDKPAYNDKITITHILHNRKRHNKPHTGSIEKDNSYLTQDSVRYIASINVYFTQYIKEKYNVDMAPEGTNYAAIGVAA